MKEQLHINGLLLLFLFNFVAVIFFLLGRYVLWFKAGAGIVRKATVKPERTVSIRDFGKGDIYKAMASQLKRKGTISLMSENIEQSKKKLSRAGGWKPEDLTVAKLEGNNWKITCKS